jgi:hypothetical protein
MIKHTDLLFKRSIDSGDTFGNITTLISRNSSLEVSLLSSASNLYVLWSTNCSNNEEIFFTTSNDNGTTF